MSSPYGNWFAAFILGSFMATGSASAAEESGSSHSVIDSPELAIGAPVQPAAPATEPTASAPTATEPTATEPPANVHHEPSAGPCYGAACERDSDEYSQQSAVYLSLFGPALGVGLGFDYRPIQSLAVGVGLGAAPSLGREGWGAVPWANASFLLGKEHQLEVGAGLSVWFLNDVDLLPGPLVAYRYQSRQGGFFFRLSVNGLMTFNSREPIVPWPGLALGGTWLD